jgi:hypothetical protein
VKCTLCFLWNGDCVWLVRTKMKFDFPYCRSVKLNFIYISRMNIWCDLPVEHTFHGFCAMDHVITYIKWLLMYWILCVWFLGWESFFSWHYCVHTCCVAASCPFDVEGSLARDVVCVEPESGCSPFLVQWLDWVEQWLCYLPHFRAMAEVKHQPYLAWNKPLIKQCLHFDNFVICP